MRSGGRCDYCGQYLDNGERLWDDNEAKLVYLDAHHRLQRSLRGKNNLGNLMALHRRCHNTIHEANSYGLGHLVHSWDDPVNVPVRLHDGWYFLTDSGETRSVAGPVGGWLEY